MTFKILKGEQALAHSVLGRLIAVYGTPGAGKTGFALSTTVNNKVLYIDTENAAGKVFGSLPDTMKNKDNFSTVNVESLADAVALLKDPNINLADYDIIVFDSMTHLIEAEVRRIREMKGRVSLPDWGDIGQAFKDMLHLLQMRGINVLFTVHEEETASKEGTMQHRPKTDGKSSVAGLIQRADNLLFLEIVDGERKLHSMQCERFIAKARDPLKNVYEGADVNFSTVAKNFAKYPQAKTTPAQMKEFDALIAKAEFSDIEKFKAFLGWDGKSDLMIDVWLRGMSILEQRIETLNAQKDDTTSDDDS